MRRVRGITLVLAMAAIGVWPAAGATASSTSMTAHVRVVENESTGKYLFKAKSLSVSVGDKVIWNNKSDAPHTVTFNTGTYDKPLPVGGSVSRTFKKAGTFKYHCEIHTYMTAKVVVS